MGVCMMNHVCDTYGDYQVVDVANGLYEVWYVNPHDDYDNQFMSEWEGRHEAEWNALCYHNADVALQQARTSR